MLICSLEYGAFRNVQYSAASVNILVLWCPLSALSVNNNWRIPSFFCVLCFAVEELGLSPVGEDTGTADVLSRLILESRNANRHLYYCFFFLPGAFSGICMCCIGVLNSLCAICVTGEEPSIKPLFFPCGSIKREVLPTALRGNGKSCSQD